MKKENWLLATLAGAGIGAIVYSLLARDFPAGAVPVKPFDMNRYLGKWYEIARLPNSVEKNLKNLTEEYSAIGDGKFKVVTKAYNFRKNKWRRATGTIKFGGPEDVGMLMVSYFGPFYLSYNVLAIDADYRYALVSGSGLDYLWILSREMTIPDDIKSRFLSLAWKTGFKVEELEWV